MLELTEDTHNAYDEMLLDEDFDADSISMPLDFHELVVND